MSFLANEKDINLVKVGYQPITPGQTTMSASIPVAIASDQTLTVTTSPSSSTNLGKVGGTSISLGQTTMSASIPVTLASNQSTLTVSDSSAESSLTTLAGAVSSSKYQNNLAQFGGSNVALGQTTMSASLPITIASNQSALAVTDTSAETSLTTLAGTVTSSKLQTNISQVGGNAVALNAGNASNGCIRVCPAGNVTQLVAINDISNVYGQKIMATSFPVVIASDQSSIAVTASGTVSIAGTVSDNIVKFGGSNVSLGQTTMSSSIPVTIASDQPVSNPYAIYKYQNTSASTMYYQYSVLAYGSNVGAQRIYIPEGWDTSNNPTIYSINTPQTLYFSSSAAGDSSQVAVLYGYDGSGNYLTESVHLNASDGRTKTATAIHSTYLSVTGFFSKGSTPYTGNIYLYDNIATVTNGVPSQAIAIIPSGSNTLKANINWFNVPISTSTYLGYLSISLTGSVITTHILKLKATTLVPANVVGANTNEYIIKEWPISTNNIFNNYEFKFRIPDINVGNGPTTMWFEVAYSGTDLNARVIIDFSYVLAT